MKFFKAAGFVCLSFIFTSCSSVYEIAYPTLFDGKYDSEFPYKNRSEQLEAISSSIKLVNSLAFYKSYVLDPSKSFTKQDIDLNNIERQAVQEISY